MSDVPPSPPRHIKITITCKCIVNRLVIVKIKFLDVFVALPKVLPLKSSAPCKATCCLQCALTNSVLLDTVRPHNLSLGDNHLDNERFCQTIVRDSRHNHLCEGGLGNRLFNRPQLCGCCREHWHVWLALANFHRHR